MSPRAFFDTVKSGRNDLRIINDKTVLRVQLINNIFKYFMLNITGFPVQNHQSGAGTVRQRILGDQFFRQIIIKI